MLEKILIAGPAWVGDMVMAQSLFKLLKMNRPDCVIDVMGPNWSLPLIARMPEVTTAIPLSIGHGQLHLKQRYQLAKQLKANRYTQAIVLPNSFKSALIPWMASIPTRTGWLGEMRWFALNDIRYLNKKNYPLMIDRFMALGLPPNTSLPSVYPLPELQVTVASQTATLSKYNMAFEKKPILILCPGAEFGAAKRWPEAYYAKVANTQLAEGWAVWILGSPKDVPSGNEIAQLTNQRAINLTGKTSLVEAVDLLSLATCVVSNDSGLMHIAAALHRPLVAIYGPTSAAFTPPLHSKSKVVSLSLSCQPCFQRICPLKHHRCMQDLLPEQVLPVMRSLL